MLQKPSNKVALVTGASSGIGRAFCIEHAQRGGDLVVVARNVDALKELATSLTDTYEIAVRVIDKDLSLPGAAKEIYHEVQATGIDIDILINNAGFGGHGFFHERDIESDAAMIQVNLVALTELTHLFIQDMHKRRRGKILNVSSTASFMPGPLQAVYYATKAYVTSFSQAIAKELEGTGISVTALCPGAVDTGFVKAGNLEGVDLFKHAKSPASVAKIGYQGMLDNKLVVINERNLRFLINWIVPLLPRSLVLSMSKRAMEKVA